MRLLLSLSLIIWGFYNAFSQNVINVTHDDALFMVGNMAKVYSNEENKAPSVENILSDIGFKQNATDHILLGGRNPEKIWIKLVVHNQTKEAIFLESIYPLLDTFSLYYVENGLLQSLQQSGQKFAFGSRSLDINNLTLALPPTDKPVTYLINAKVKYACNVKLRMGTYKSLIKDYHRNDTLNGIFIGAILAFIFYNIFVYNKLREPVYLIYSLYLLFIGGYVLRHAGITYEFFLRYSPQLHDYLLVFQGLAGLTGLYFVQIFMDSKKNAPRVNKFFDILYIFFAVNIVVTMLGFWELGIFMAYLSSPLSTLVVIYLGYQLWDNGNQYVKYCVIGWCCLAIGMLIFILENTGILSYNLFTQYALHIGICLEALFLSFAVAHRFSLISFENSETHNVMIRALEENRRLIEEKNKMLEEKMQGHTYALEDAMSKVNESEMKLKEYARQLEKSNRELTEFAHIASHDLKAPIRGILSFSQLFERRNQAKFDDTDREYFNYIKNNAAHSARLIEDLLNYSKIDKNLGDPTEVDLNKCVFLANMNLQNIIQEKNAEIIYQNLPILRGHSSLMTHLLQNLIGNGIKYNKSEKPTIEIKAFNDAKEGLVFSVKDNGIGIPKQHQKEVFAMFRRLHGQAEYEGTGIGLSFCTRIVETYGGKLWLESEDGQGTTFYFTLPKAPVVEAELCEVA